MFKRYINVLSVIEENAIKYPDKIAVADEKNYVTYKDFVAKAKSRASVLAKKVSPKNPIAILGEKSVETVINMFAVVYAGCFYVPLNPLHPMERREKILSVLNNPLVLAEASLLSLLPTNYEKVTLYNDLKGEVDNVLLEKIARNHIDKDPLYVMFTSGSTGTPKGICVSHSSVIDFIGEFITEFNCTENDVFANQAPLDFDVSVKDIYSGLFSGATVNLIPKKFFSFPTMLLDYLEERKVTTIIWAVSAMCILSTFHAFKYKVPKLSKILFSGEAMPVKHLNVWKTYYPNAEFVNLYGPTEITCNCTFYKIEKGIFDKEVLPIGKAFKNERVFLLDDNGNEIKEKNKNGEICVAGTTLSLGYYNCEKETQKAFCLNPLNKSYPEVIYKTGDIGYLDENEDYVFVGRKDFQIKHQGHRIELSEIENAMLSLKSVLRALCLYDNQKHKIWAFYQGEAEEIEVLNALREKLPPYMVANKCVKVDKFDLTENGKIDRKKLKEIYNI